MEPEHTPIVVDTEAKKYRFTCPHGHVRWYAWNGCFSCKTCKENRDSGEDVETVYLELVDKKTGGTVTRSDLRLPLANTREGVPARGD